VAAVLIGGPDNLSAVDPSRVVDLAARSQIPLYTYELDAMRRNDGRGMPGTMGPGGNLLPTMPPGGRLPSSVFRDVRVPRSVAEGLQALERAAERTGGRPGDYRHNALSSLRDLLEEFRRSYVLYFRPSGAADAAWHDLTVSLRGPGAGRYTVRARPGYIRVAGAADGRPLPVADVRSDTWTAPGPAPAVAATGAPVTAGMLPPLLERYGQGEHAAVVAELRSASNADEAAAFVRREGERWIESGTTGSAPGRRGVAAALALEVARPTHSLPGSRLASENAPTWSERRTLIFWGAAMLGDSMRVTSVERAWYLAAIASLHGQLQFGRSMQGWKEATDLLAQAIVRVPDEGRHRWTDARVLEQWMERGVLSRRTRPDELRNAYEAAASRADGDLRAEMQLHLVSRFLDANKDADEALGPIVDEGRREAAQEALARTAFAEGLTGDEFLVYMCRFFRGRLHDRLDQRAEAEAAYRAALEVFPGAQSASMPLATLLFLRGEEAEARRLVDAVLASPGAEDPWRVYHLQDYRRLPAYIAEMRAALSAER
jgi:tetratricopeptide (TPR) repeat protein